MQKIRESVWMTANRDLSEPCVLVQLLEKVTWASNTALLISPGNVRWHLCSFLLTFLPYIWFFFLFPHFFLFFFFAEVIVLSTVPLHWSQGIVLKCCVPCSRWILPVCKYFCMVPNNRIEVTQVCASVYKGSHCLLLMHYLETKPCAKLIPIWNTVFLKG